MALLFLDSFDHYSSAQGSRKWTQWVSCSISSSGRTGSCGLPSGGGPSVTFGTEYLTLTSGEAYKTPAFGNAILSFLNVPQGLGATLKHVGDGRLVVSVLGADLVATGPPSTFVMSLNVYYYMEFSATVSVGAPVGGLTPVNFNYEARANEATILTGSLSVSPSTAGGGGHPAAPATGAGFNTLHIEGPGGGLSAYADDLYLTDGEFLGDVKIAVLYPNAAGDTTMFAPTPAGSNFNNVKEHPADDDASYNSSAAVNDVDLYNLDDITGFTGVIKGAQALWLVKKTDAGSAAVLGQWKSAGTQLAQTHGKNFVSPNGFYPSYVDYNYSIQAERKSLFTAADWTVAEVNALQLGLKRTI